MGCLQTHHVAQMKETESHQRLNISSAAFPLPTQEMQKEVNHVEITLSNLPINERHTFHTSIAQEIRWIIGYMRLLQLNLVQNPE